MSPLITGSPKDLFTLSSTSPMRNPQGLTWVQILSMDKTAVYDREFITYRQEGRSSPVHTCFLARVERGRCWLLRARGHWAKISLGQAHRKWLGINTYTIGPTFAPSWDPSWTFSSLRYSLNGFLFPWSWGCHGLNEAQPGSCLFLFT